MFVMHLKVRLDHPVMAVQALALEQESVRPGAPVCPFVQVAFGAADHLVNKRDAPGKPDAPGPGVEFQKLPVRQAGHYHGLLLGYVGLHGDSAGWKGKPKCEPGKIFLTG